MEEEKEVIQEVEVVQTNKTDWVRVIFLIVMIISVGVLLFTTITIIKEANIIKNPVGASLAHWNLSSCSCYNNLGKLIEINSTT